jgi:hypothetical protein
MDLLAYTVKYFKENDIIQHNSLEEEIDFLTQKINELKDKQHELNVEYSEIIKCTENEFKQKYDEYRNNRIEETKNQYSKYIAEQTELTNLLAHINSINTDSTHNLHIINIKNNIIIDLKQSAERLLLPKEIPSFVKWKNDIIEEYKYQLNRYESDIVTYEVKLDRFKKLLVLITESNDN